MNESLDSYKGRKSGNVLPLELKPNFSFKNQFQSLSNPLALLRKGHAKIKGKNTQIRGSSVPITQAPVEILSAIFRTVVHIRIFHDAHVSEAERHRLNLLLVCKQWYDVVLDDPFMWNFIQIRAPYEKRPNKYVPQLLWGLGHMEMCLSRSKEAPLDVVLHLAATDFPLDHTREEVRDEVRKFVSSDPPIGWLADINWETCPVARVYDQLLIDWVKGLVGENGNYIKRWRSLRLTPPDEAQTVGWLWPILNQRLPLLRFISLAGFWGGWSSVALSSLFLSVEEMDLSFTPVERLPPCPRLRYLQLIAYGTDFQGDFRCFPALRELSFDARSGGLSASPSARISLPDLNHLILPQTIQPYSTTTFDCNRLDKLTIHSDTGYTKSPLVKIYSLAEVVIYNQDLIDNGNSQYLMIDTILPQMSSAHTIQVRHSMVHHILGLVASYRGQGHLPSLRTVIARDKKKSLQDQLYLIGGDGTAQLS